LAFLISQLRWKDAAFSIGLRSANSLKAGSRKGSSQWKGIGAALS
jgi:hypothetical protein